MKVALIGATGFVGSRILNEALDRNHEVTAIVRRTQRLPVRAGLTARKADVLDVDTLADLLAGQDAVISAFSPDQDAGDKYEAMVAGAKAIIEATKRAGVPRLLAVGGAGSLEIAPGQQVIDQPGFPEEWKPGATGTREFLYLLKEQPDLEWTFLSPAQVLQPGERTGEFRLGGDQVMVDSEGECRISVEDYAVAMVDELEEPSHMRQRFCVAY
jgi:uncharacterized protein